MSPNRIAELYSFFRSTLLDDIIPFWLRHSPDRKYGGYFHHLDRDGSIYSSDKAVWMQCRQLWMLSKLCNSLGARDEWLHAARLGYDFIMRYAFDSDGRMFFLLTRDGAPLRKRRYIFSESFGVIALAEYAKASGDDSALQKAIETYRLMVRVVSTPGILEPKIYPATRRTESLSVPMILLAATQEIRLHDSSALYESVADDAVARITGHFLKPARKALLETTGGNGEELDLPAGRLVNPGHALETAWFLLHEAEHRKDPSLQARALEIIDWSLERGWDREYGGIYAFLDLEGKPCEQLEWDMKLWWPHTEALYALLLAWFRTRDASYADWYEKVHEYTFHHFPDAEFGEWYGYLHRDGSVSNRLKGSLWKGCFHVPRALWLAMTLTGRMKQTLGPAGRRY